jgi:hypothetical protein
MRIEVKQLLSFKICFPCFLLQLLHHPSPHLSAFTFPLLLWLYSCGRADTDARTDTQTDRRTHTQTDGHTHTDTHTHTETDTHTHTHTHIRALAYTFIFVGGYWSFGTFNLGTGLQHLS